MSASPAPVLPLDLPVPVAPVSPSAPAAVRFTLELGRALHRYGTPAHQLEDALIRVSARLGIEGRFFSTPTSIFASFGSPEDMRTCLIRVHPGELDLEKLTRLDSLMEAVVAGRCTAEEGGTRLVQILAAPAPHGARLLLLCHLLVAACWGRLLGGGPREMLVAGLASLCVGLFAVGEGRWPALGRVLTPLSALLASTLAVLGAHFFGPLSLQVATLSGLVVLLPGLTLTTAVTELATRNLMAGTSRLVGSGLVFLQLGFGVAVGGQLAQWLPPVQGMVPQPMLPPWTEGLALLVGTMSTGVLVQTRRRDVPWAVAASLFTFGAARLGAFLIGPQLGAFVGALALGTASNLLSRYRGGPAAVTLVPGILMLVPGSVGYRSVASLLARDTLTGVDTAFNMLMVAVALVAGLLVANAVAPSRRAL